MHYANALGALGPLEPLERVIPVHSGGKELETFVRGDASTLSSRGCVWRYVLGVLWYSGQDEEGIRLGRAPLTNNKPSRCLLPRPEGGRGECVAVRWVSNQGSW